MIGILPWLLAIMTTVPDTAPTCKTADQRVEALVEAQVHKLNGIEYCQSRLYHTLDDLDRDSHEDFVLVFAIEDAAGGNNSSQYLAVFLSSKNWEPQMLKVGERGQRFITGIDVNNAGVLILNTSEYTPKDPMCCPSGKGKLRFRIDQGHLTPLKTPAATPHK